MESFSINEIKGLGCKCSTGFLPLGRLKGVVRGKSKPVMSRGEKEVRNNAGKRLESIYMGRENKGCDLNVILVSVHSS